MSSSGTVLGTLKLAPLEATGAKKEPTESTLTEKLELRDQKGSVTLAAGTTPTVSAVPEARGRKFIK